MPLTPGAVLVRWPLALALVAAALAALAATVAVTEAGPVAGLDGAVEDLAIDARHPALDGVLRAVTELGGGWVVVPLACASAMAVVRRRPAIAGLLVVAVAVRYGLEDVIKDAIGRDRPVGARVVHASGHAFPSGHVLGAVVGWGVVPAAVVVATGSRRWWRWAVAAWALVTVGVAVSRAYLGVHWFTDTVGSVLLGLLILAGVDLAARTGARRSGSPGCS